MAAKYVFVTGGVVSSLGKGITAASLGRLLKARGRQWPDHVHVFSDGRIVRSGGKELAFELEEKGYASTRQASLGASGTKR